MTRYKLTIEYKGSDFYGWQLQDSLPTIQGSIEDAIEKFSHQRVLVQSAGRTDAGVHAHGQIAHIDLEPLSRNMDEYAILKAINAHLRPMPISILNVEKITDDFHARFSAKNKLYRYRIINRPAFLTFDKGLAYHVKRVLDVKAMHEAAQILLGKHDFSTFRDSECQANTPIRTLDCLNVEKISNQEIVIEAEAMSFLHHMVRNIVGTLILVGEGKWSAEDVLFALNAKDRTKGGSTAPAEGLYLVRVDY
ncbi:MAG: tRNA pseudouridine(38-40) synthase TruA [Alphaproteobacteria bacterium]|nr:tRNA pseudouridine(38-40) synthase TruA [Alphaproteobacteria bacterium]